MRDPIFRHDYPDGESTLEVQDNMTSEVQNGEEHLPVKGDDPPELPGLEVYHGLAGDIVGALEAHTEAHPVALLGQLLVAVGNVVGRTSYFEVEGDKHYLNENLVLVGISSGGRKGTSWGRVRQVLGPVDESWTSGRVLDGGLSTGEGLITQVRDPVTKENHEGELEVVDQGVDDKRLLVVEGEFARPLTAMAREGNTLSAVLRSAWDTGSLATLTKGSPQRATDAHVSIVGHVTKPELLKLMSSTSATNGFANRFMFVSTWRTRCLPDGGAITPEELAPFTARLAEVVQSARRTHRMERTEAARTLWRSVYPTLSSEKPGLLGSVLGRAPAHAIRLACIYAVLDQSAVVDAPHLRAALEFWGYCERSARYVFGGAVGDPVSDAILKALRERPEGITRTEINAVVFNRHKTSQEIARALGSLLSHGLVRRREDRTGGRPAERWLSVAAP